jgi:hypothetical protein
MPGKGVFADVQRFIDDHAACGPVTRIAHPPTASGYRIKVMCACGEVFDRWVTPEAARHDLIHSNLLACSN